MSGIENDTNPLEKKLSITEHPIGCMWLSWDAWQRVWGLSSSLAQKNRLRPTFSRYYVLRIGNVAPFHASLVITVPGTGNPQ